jgi:branched-subunit amino acid transport protein AzlD
LRNRYCKFVSVFAKIVTLSEIAMHFILPLNRTHIIIRSVYFPFSTGLVVMGASLWKQTVLSIVDLRDVESILNRGTEV